MQKRILLTITLLISTLFLNNIFAQDTADSLSKFIEKKRNYNKTSKNGYSVLLYNGNEEKALKIYNEFKEEYQEIQLKLTYVSPDWKVLTPAFSTKIEAERVYLIIKEKYPNAQIL